MALYGREARNTSSLFWKGIWSLVLLLWKWEREAWSREKLKMDGEEYIPSYEKKSWAVNDTHSDLVKTPNLEVRAMHIKMTSFAGMT
jgi:hypothetical protein